MSANRIKTILISGGSRGIGLAIAKRLARDRCHLVLASKTVKPHPKLGGTLQEAVDTIMKNPKTHNEMTCEFLQLDLRNSDNINQVVDQVTQKETRPIDILINNASAIDNRGTDILPPKKYDLMHSINARGTFLMTQACLPHLLKSEKQPRVLTLSPPISLNPLWFKLGGTAYTMSKYSMSMMTMGLAEEFRGKINFNSLWPRTVIWTEATKMLMGENGEKYCRSPEIMAEAAYQLVNGQVLTAENGKCLLDEEIIKQRRLDPNDYNLSNKKPMDDLFVGNPNKFMRRMMQYQAVLKIKNMFRQIVFFGVE